MPDHHNWRGRVRPGRTSSLLGMVVGIGMALFALSMMGGPMGGMGGFGSGFLVLFVVVALGLAAFHGYNFFSERGASVMEVDFDMTGRGGAQHHEAQGHGGGSWGEQQQGGGGSGGDFEERLRKLERLRDDRLITEDEYRTKRAEIIGERW